MPKAGIAIAVVAAAAQFARPARMNPPVHSDLIAPVEVKALLRDACYDCHSNETRWPRYSTIAPLSWLMQHDVNRGRERLNFSQWAEYASDPATAAQKLEKIAQFVTRGDMAPWYYRMLHPTARLTPTQRDALIGWVNQETIHQQLSR
ncbi:MAG: heme-binding domain-containing protein [Candidatus Binatia bacterium]